MVDRLTPEQRRRAMQGNRGFDTSPEIRLRHALHGLGFRYTLRSKLPGRPDIVFPSRNTVIFVDGCFWHRCPKHFIQPATNREKWTNKLDANVRRDRKVDRELKGLGWRVIRVWEHEIGRELSVTLQKLSKILRSKG